MNNWMFSPQKDITFEDVVDLLFVLQIRLNETVLDRMPPNVRRHFRELDPGEKKSLQDQMMRKLGYVPANPVEDIHPAPAGDCSGSSSGAVAE